MVWALTIFYCAIRLSVFPLLSLGGFFYSLESALKSLLGRLPLTVFDVIDI